MFVFFWLVGLLGLWFCFCCKPLASHLPQDCDPASRFGRRGCTAPKEEWEQQWVVAHYKRWLFGYDKTADLFNQLFGHLGHNISAGTVRNIVKGFYRRAKAAQARSHHQFPAPQPANTCWCLDFSGKEDETGRQHMVLGIMD